MIDYDDVFIVVDDVVVYDNNNENLDNIHCISFKGFVSLSSIYFTSAVQEFFDIIVFTCFSADSCISM